MAAPVTTAPARRKPHSKDEAFIQAAVAMVLDELRLWWFHPANELGGFVTPGHLAQLVGQGLKPGAPDVLIFERAPSRPEVRGVFLELKSATGSASRAQRLWRERLAALGWVGDFYRSLASALAFLDSLGWPVRDALSRLEERGWVVEGDRMVRAVTTARRTA